MNDVSDEVAYAPPKGKGLLRTKHANWEPYIHEREAIDLLIHLAVGGLQSARPQAVVARRARLPEIACS